MALGLVYWLWLTPAIDTMKTLSPGWIAYLLVRNMAVVALIYGALELQLYVGYRQLQHCCGLRAGGVVGGHADGRSRPGRRTVGHQHRNGQDPRRPECG